MGNTVLYGAVCGETYFSGVAGERFCVRNSGASAVVEGLGDHGCEYMTGGVVVCLGKTGRNFASGMCGGIAYVFDEQGNFDDLCNQQMVSLYAVDKDKRNENPDDLLMADEARLKKIIQTHHKYTGSKIAQWILQDWQNQLGKFVKVLPYDFATALMEQRDAFVPELKEVQNG